ncbi:hypothetical protein BDV40DRAFT_298439 [Aspergillus tamarii]|uniref:Cyanovirin-N domain-containing protein n=1 Tax=Aspergillus tamarii TaxID=41984 RepID=A0A5N6V0E1_ASPTM|nr:hypothetical protein BDV40DRAFT_298439 [Aspergillus tamarii]
MRQIMGTFVLILMQVLVVTSPQLPTSSTTALTPNPTICGEIFENEDSTWLSATCQTAGGPGKKNELPLDRCLGYSPSKGLHGKLMGRAFEGAYCYECTPGPAPGVIRCVCATGDALFTSHDVNLNEIIGSYGGTLTCFGLPAVRVNKESPCSWGGKNGNSSTSTE